MKESVFLFPNETMEAIAEVCHEANAAYCRTLGDNSQKHWEEAPMWQRQSAFNGVKFHLEGEHNPEESHKNWMDEKIKAGWTYGKTKDEAAKTHPCLVPFSELDPSQRFKDILFGSIVHIFEQALTKGVLE